MTKMKKGAKCTRERRTEGGERGRVRARFSGGEATLGMEEFQ